MKVHYVEFSNNGAYVGVGVGALIVLSVLYSGSLLGIPNPVELLSYVV